MIEDASHPSSPEEDLVSRDPAGTRAGVMGEQGEEWGRENAQLLAESYSPCDFLGKGEI